MTGSALRLVGICLACVSSGAAILSQGMRRHTMPARDVERELLVPVLIQSRGPFWFALDTGIAHSAIDRGVVGEARLNVVNEEGKHRSTSPIRLDVGGEAFETTLDVLDIGVSEYQRGYDQPLAGVLGMDFFSKFIVILDYDAQLVTLEDPLGDNALERGEPIPLKLKDSFPYLDATIKLPGHGAVRHSFMLDTSTGDAINDDVFAHLRQAKIGPDLGRAEYFLIGPYRFTGINGTGGPPKLGGELLHCFRVTVDVPHSRLFLEPSRHFADAFLFDTSGLDLERSNDGLKILRVFPRTPGEEAHLASGDIIISIDGEPTSAFSVPQIRLMFHEVGSHTLLVESKGVRKTVELKLRTLL
jgi:hypothetical protein